MAASYSFSFAKRLVFQVCQRADTLIVVVAYWDRSITDATCYAFGSTDETSFVSTYVSHSAFNVLLDFAVLVLPAPIVFRQAMTRKEKFAALGLGAMGTL